MYLDKFLSDVPGTAQASHRYLPSPASSILQGLKFCGMLSFEWSTVAGDNMYRASVRESSHSQYKVETKNFIIFLYQYLFVLVLLTV